VIAYAYDERMNRMSWRRFMIVRLIRLYPMLFVGTLVGGVLLGLSLFQKHELDAYFFIITAGSFLLLPIGLAYGMVAYPINIAVWSPFFEFAVNAVYATKFRQLSNRNLAVFVALSGAALIPMALWVGPSIGFETPVAFLLGFVRVVYPFWAGVFLFRVARLRMLPNFPIGVIGLALAILLLIPVDDPIYNLALGLIAFPVAVAFASYAKYGDLTGRICSALERLSYPLYLIHWPVFRALRGLADLTHLKIAPSALLTGGSFMGIVVAQILLIRFDEPVRRWLSESVRRRSALITQPRLTQ
jgi:peptidoglycan/LPS O-acetylase OafA/YrhL